MRRRKKNRKLPPAYPNGWYAVLESKVLKVGQAREMYALGEYGSDACRDMYISYGSCFFLTPTQILGIGIVKCHVLE